MNNYSEEAILVVVCLCKGYHKALVIPNALINSPPRPDVEKCEESRLMI
jgi:hypothetical protein